MRSHREEREHVREVLAEVDPDEPLTASEIRDVLAEHGVDIESSHRVATMLGRWAEDGGVDVIREQPYRYRFSDGT